MTQDTNGFDGFGATLSVTYFVNTGNPLIRDEDILKITNPATRGCPICPKTFSHGYALRGHFIRVHLRQKRFICPVCDAGFWSNSDLERHMPRHTGQRFICDACGRTYTSKQRLTEHFRHPSDCWLKGPMLKYAIAVTKLDIKKNTD